MKKRLNFKCWNCQRGYSLLRELEGKPKLAVECPFCGEEGIADLDPYREDSVEVFRFGTSDQKRIGTALHFPDVIPTIQPEN